MSNQEQKILQALAHRVVQRRQSLGLSLKDCASKANLSTRYLMQVEAGQANISVIKLNQLCIALEVRLAELLSEGTRGEIDSLLSELNQQELQEAHTLLKARFKSSQVSLISLLGVRGAGKSTLGRLLANDLGWPMIELDEEIERIAGLSLAEVFSVHGEPYYRRLEGEVLEELQQQNFSAIIATGGSIVTHPQHYALLKAMSYTIYLEASAEEHMNRVIAQGDQRPMRDHPKAMSELKKLLASRAPLYQKADFHLLTSQCTEHDLLQQLKHHLYASKVIH